MAWDLQNVLSCLITSAFWGITNPLIKKCTAKTHRDPKLVTEFFDLIRNRKYVFLFLMNQIGSILFFLTLQNADLSLAVPVTNALTFVFTGIVGIILGEEKPDSRALSGIIFILIGITLCLLEKVNR